VIAVERRMAALNPATNTSHDKNESEVTLLWLKLSMFNGDRDHRDSLFMTRLRSRATMITLLRRYPSCQYDLMLEVDSPSSTKGTVTPPVLGRNEPSRR